ncbi:GNAT family N-acetyltransferase [Shewanella sp. NKUCC05_KAH]|uniref:GNAT family N-acetyltransferase n=1 Tax=Shewanella TaxID=22 RepID=UPI001C5BB42C|nr:GNAT family N-acetyltransferase [Shewanella sp. NKUCC05_KAH]MBW3526402.1 GNAT family N-acetyltransferase [Shewanella sp. NKUCC05_KAH]
MKIFEFIQAKEADWDYLLQLRKLTMTPHLERSGQFLTEKEHHLRLKDQYDCSFLVRYKECIIGTLKYRQTDNSVEIMQIQIHPVHQQQGFGKAIIQQVLDGAKAKTVLLTVLKNNQALALYLRLGFNIVGEDMYEYHMQIKC